MNIRMIVKFKKRNAAGLCRAMRCKEEKGLKEFDRPDGPTVLLCPEHLARALQHNEQAPPSELVTAPAVDTPAIMTGTDGATGNPIYSLDGGTTWAFGEAPDDPPYDESAHAPVATVEAAFGEPVDFTPEVVDSAPAGAVEATTVVVEHAHVAALVAPLAAEYTDMAPQLIGFVVNDQATVDNVGELLLQVKGKLSELEKGRKRITKPLLDAKRAVDDLFRPATDAAKKIEGMLKGALAEFVDRQAAAQVTALQAGQHEVALAIVPPTMPAGISTTTVWKWRITDVRLIPADYLVVDSAKVQARVNALKGNCDIPGVEAYPESGVRAATK